MSGEAGGLKSVVFSALTWEVLAIWFGRGLLLVALWMGKQLLVKVDNMSAHLEQQQASIQALTHELSSKTALRWTQIDQRLWATLLAQRNPDLVIPEPVHVDLPGEPLK